MRVKFQADADLDGRILRGLRRSVREIDIRTSGDAGLTGLEDLEVLWIATESGRILVSQDRRTMPGHFARYAVRRKSPGVILLRETDLGCQRSRRMGEPAGVDFPLNWHACVLRCDGLISPADGNHLHKT